MKYQNILFDLDGTVIDSRLGLGNSLTYALANVGMGDLINRELLDSFLGVPLLQGMEEYCGMDRETANKAVDYFQKYYGERGMFESKPFDGFESMLKLLSHNGKVLAVATNGYTENAKIVLGHHCIAKYFSIIRGLTSLGADETKQEVIRGVVKDLNIDTDNTVMVGDRFFDIQAAKDSGVHSVGVLYGYGEEKEMVESGPDEIAENVDKLTEILLG